MMFTKYMFVIIIIGLLVTNCNSDNNTAETVFVAPTALGLSYSESNLDFITTYNSIKTTLESNENITIVAELNHTANAQSVNLDLRDTRIIFFGNPAIGTPIMQENQLAGLDLPQHIMIYKDANLDVVATFNSSNYLSARFGVQGANTLPMAQQALTNIVNTTTGNEVLVNSSGSVANSNGIVTINSSFDFDTTYTNLRDIISANENLSIVFELNHMENAATVDLDLRPTRVIAFGNPNLGTPLMRDSQTTALDLPQKILVWEDENGAIKISYNDPTYIQNRHSISEEQNETLMMISGALADIASGASN